jgi:hypothetical protein
VIRFVAIWMGNRVVQNVPVLLKDMGILSRVEQLTRIMTRSELSRLEFSQGLHRKPESFVIRETIQCISQQASSGSLFEENRSSVAYGRGYCR